MKQYNLAGGMLLAMIAFCWWGCQSPGEQQAVSPQTDTVYISMMKFKPAVLWVNQYDTVVWVNQDIVKHDVTAFPGKEWYSGPLPTDSSWKMMVTDSFNYFCQIHPTMKGKIKIRRP